MAQRVVGALMLGLACAGLACSSGLSARVRQVTYPPTFHYLERGELKDTMAQLARLVTRLDDVMRAGDAAGERREEVARILDEMVEASDALGPGGWPSNHPVVSRNIEQFRRELRAARRDVTLDPPSFYLAGSVSGACLHCHAER